MLRPLTFAFASFVAAGFMAMAPASAETGQRASYELHYAELNLENDRGAQTLLRRIRYAARQACGDQRGPLHLAERAEIRRCIRETMDQSVRDVNRARLTALYREREARVIVASN